MIEFLREISETLTPDVLQVLAAVISVIGIFGGIAYAIFKFGGFYANLNRNESDTRRDIREIQGDIKTVQGDIKTVQQNVAHLKETTVTKSDFNEFKSEIKSEVREIKSDFNEFKSEVRTDIGEIKSDFNEFKSEVRADIKEIKTDVGAFKSEVGEFKSEVRKTVHAIFKILSSDTATKSLSPERLTKVGEEIADAIDANAILDKHHVALSALVNRDNPQTLYDLQQACFSVVDEHLPGMLTPKQLTIAKNKSYQHGIPLENALTVIAVLLRDFLIAEKGWTTAADKNSMDTNC